MPTRKKIGKIVFYNNSAESIEIQYDKNGYCERFCEWFQECDNGYSFCFIFREDFPYTNGKKPKRLEECKNIEKYITGNFNINE
jgi:hypothetical protein